MTATQGMILAAGLGTRLQPLTLFRAKPAIPFLNRPFVSYSLDLLRRTGIKEIIINLHHLPESIIESIGSQDDAADSPRLKFSREETILGTAGAIGRVRDFFSRDPFIVCNGKIYFEEDLSAALRFHQDSGATATLVLVPCRPSDPYPPVFLDEEQNVIRFGSAQERNTPGEGYVFTGVHILSRDVLPFIPEGSSDTVKDLYPALMREGHRLRGFVSRAFWCECSSPALYLKKMPGGTEKSGPGKPDGERGPAGALPKRRCRPIRGGAPELCAGKLCDLGRRQDGARLLSAQCGTLDWRRAGTGHAFAECSSDPAARENQRRCPPLGSARPFDPAPVRGPTDE